VCTCISCRAIACAHLFFYVHSRFYKNYTKSKKKAFTKYVKKYTDGKREVEAELEQLRKHCCVIRVLAHTQVSEGQHTCTLVNAVHLVTHSHSHTFAK